MAHYIACKLTDHNQSNPLVSDNLQAGLQVTDIGIVFGHCADTAYIVKVGPAISKRVVSEGSKKHLPRQESPTAM